MLTGAFPLNGDIHMSFAEITETAVLLESLDSFNNEYRHAQGGEILREGETSRREDCN